MTNSTTTKSIANIVSTLRLRGMKVLGRKNKVILIDQPSHDFMAGAIDITENIKGIRHRSGAVQFHGFTVRWNKEQ